MQVCKAFDESRASAFDLELGALKAIRAQPSSALPHLVDFNWERRLLLTTPVLQPWGVWGGRRRGRHVVAARMPIFHTST